jgi:hypothetical protein
MQTKIVSYEQAWAEVRRLGDNFRKVDTSSFSNEEYYGLATRAVTEDWNGLVLSYIDDSRLSNGQYHTLVYNAVEYSGRALKYVNKARFSAEEYYSLVSFAVTKRCGALEHVDPAKLPAERLHLTNYYTPVVLAAVYKYPSDIKFVKWGWVTVSDKVVYNAAKGKGTRGLFNP